MKPERISLLFLLSYTCALFLLQWWQQSWYPPLLWIGIIVMGFMGMLCAVFGMMRAIGTILVAIACALFIAFSTVAHSASTEERDTVQNFATKQTVVLAGTIAEEPDKRPLKTNYTIAVEQIETASGVVAVQGRTLATDLRGFPEYRYGDTVLVKGTLERPGKFEDFDYGNYLSISSVYSTISRAGFDLVEIRGGNVIFRGLFALKNAFEAQINKLYPEPHASFLAGLLTGSRKGIPEHVLQNFNTTGLTHIIAISGYNITIIIGIITALFFWLPVKLRVPCAIAAVIAFTIFVGASAAVVRASVMGILGLIALFFGQKTNVRLLILWSLFFMTIWNPRQLWYDAGFQLSFLAVLGLVECIPLLEQYLSWLPKHYGIRETMIATLATQMMALPWISMLFGRVSLVAPFANILVLPAIPLSMLTGFLSVVTSTVLFPLGQIIAYLTWALLQWVIIVANLFARIPHASVSAKAPAIVTAIYYVLLVLVLYRFHHRYTYAD